MHEIKQHFIFLMYHFNFTVYLFIFAYMLTEKFGKHKKKRMKKNTQGNKRKFRKRHLYINEITYVRRRKKIYDIVSSF